MIKMITENEATAVIKENDISTGFFLAVLAIYMVTFLAGPLRKKLGQAVMLPAPHSSYVLLNAVFLPISPDLIF